MDTPQPVDVSRLKSILGNAKALMTKVENNDYETGHIDPRALTAEGVQELQAEGVVRPATTQQNTAPIGGYTTEQIQNSRLPDVIKKAMMERPIPQLQGLTHTFTLDDVGELADKPMGLPKTPNTSKKTPLRESNNNSNLITISRDELITIVNEAVNDKLLEFFAKSYHKTITENAVKSTINMLIKEGKLTPKKKTL